jgi:hypothetical protein
MATYEQGRDQEYLDRLDGAISAFISRYNANPSTTNRRTLFLFPGGMGSQLTRASAPFTSTPPFSYDLAWLDCGIVSGDVVNLQMSVYQSVAAPLATANAAKFYNIRGVQFENGVVRNDTVVS